MDQTSASASKPGPSTSAVNLDLPPPRPRTPSHVEEMEVDYGPAILMHPKSLLRRPWIDLEKHLGTFFLSLTPGSLCLGPQLQLWFWMMRKAVKSSDLEVLPLCYHSAQLSKIFRPLIYLRVNASNLLLPLQSGTRWDSPVMRRKYKS